MRIAVFSDVHGNLTALEAVLADIGGRAVDEIIFAGDLCLVGPRPAACVERLMRAGYRAVYGNTEDWLLGRQAPPEQLRDLAQWTYAQLEQEQRRWLDGLPFSLRVGATVGEQILIVHANPRDVSQLIFPPEVEQRLRYGRVRQPDRDLAPWLAGTDERVIAFGHLHIPFVRPWRQQTLFNISSVSMPGDGDTRAKYGLFTWDGGGWSFERVFVAYDMAPESAAYRLHRPPGWQSFVETIAVEGCVPQSV